MAPLLDAPQWDAPANVLAAMSTRVGGISTAPFDSLNLGYSTPDNRSSVAANEARVANALGIDPLAIRWVYQVHGNAVQLAESLPENAPLSGTVIEGDAIVSRTPGLVCGVKVADCLPVLFSSVNGRVVAAAHAGWRGLAAGVVENTVSAMDCAAEEIVAWLGPCIGKDRFEVGDDVKTAFLEATPIAERDLIAASFRPLAIEGKYLCDLRSIASTRLRAIGVTKIAATHACTFSEPARYFSHRRDRLTGRMAAFVGIKA